MNKPSDTENIKALLEAIPDNGDPLIMGINSFGFGGANAHVVLTEAPEESKAESGPVESDGSWPVMLSARSE